MEGGLRGGLKGYLKGGLKGGLKGDLKGGLQGGLRGGLRGEGLRLKGGEAYFEVAFPFKGALEHYPKHLCQAVSGGHFSMLRNCC